jgi:hypothetical protein
MSFRQGLALLPVLLAVITLAGCSDSPTDITTDFPVGFATPARGSGLGVTSSADAAHWSLPEHLGPELNVFGFDNRNAAISINGKSLYFGSDRPGGSGGLDLYVSHRANPHAPWDLPQNLGPGINSSTVDNNPYPTADGHFLFFTSSRAGGSGGPDLWVSHRDNVHDDAAWEPPTNLGSTINTPFIDSGPVYLVDPATGRVMIFFSSTRPGGQGSMDFYVSTLGTDGTWGTGVIIPELNTPYDDNKLAIRKDGLELFLSSNRPGGGTGASGYNIWVSTRPTTQDTWTTPALAVESAGLPAISIDGKELFMVSRQPGSGVGGRPFKNDLFVSTRVRAP